MRACRVGDGMEVNGTLVNLVMEGMGAFPTIATRYLNQAGVRDLHSDHETFYPLQIFTDLLAQMEKEIGDATMVGLGRFIPKEAIFPQEIRTLEEAMKMIDVAYHMNHRDSRGQMMFDPERTPPLLDGIGSYKCEFAPDKREVLLVCDNPYPCQFDLGIITEMVQRFKPKSSLYARVNHLSDQPCRKRGDATCTYQVRW
jgi:hypothetical protein